MLLLLMLMMKDLFTTGVICILKTQPVPDITATIIIISINNIPTLFHTRLKMHLFYKSFPPQIPPHPPDLPSRIGTARRFSVLFFLLSLSRVSTLTCDIDIAILSVLLSVRPSVCPSVRDTLVLYENGLTRHIVIVFSPYGSPTILVLPA